MTALLLVDLENASRALDRLELLDALENQTCVQCLYRDLDGVRSLRYIVPQSINLNKETREPYVRVWDAQRRADRTFGLDRITNVTSKF